MDSQEKFDYWLDIAQYDLETATNMFESGRWLYVLFMCQQAIDKLVKGLYIIYKDDNIPFSHNIGSIIDSFNSQLASPVSRDMYSFFSKLSSYYISGRYTNYKQKLSSSVTKEEAGIIPGKTKEVFA
ncbi:MAG: HEPN domain-containing protein [Deltaproteobacteria bacterium]|jgi:HEPN domain-containing protein|nr:HEPN domain-containing protein [Deltaproteobacteria bacterium]